MRSFSHILFAIFLFATVALAFQAESPRARALSAKVLCDCGCREVLGECSHRECTRKPALRQEIEMAMDKGKSDSQVLDQLAATHGTELLVTPAFHGFNTLLWIVPVGVVVIAVGATVIIQSRGRA